MKKKLLTVLLAVVMVFGVFGLTACKGSNADADYNYYAVKYEIEDEVKIQALTFQGIYKMFTTAGNFVVYVATEGEGGATKADFQKVNKLANDWGITIYHFNPELSGGFAASKGASTNIITDGVKGNAIKTVQSTLTAISKVEATEWVDNSMIGIAGKESTAKAGKLTYNGSIKKLDSKNDSGFYTGDNMAKAIAAAAGVKNPSYGSYTDAKQDVPVVPEAYNVASINTMNLFGDARLHMYNDDNGTDALIDEKEDVFVTVANYAMFEHLMLNNEGYFPVFFGGTWCGNTQAIVKLTNEIAKDYGCEKIYFFDPRLEDGTKIDVANGDAVEENKSYLASALNTRSDDSAKAWAKLEALGQAKAYLQAVTVDNGKGFADSVSYKFDSKAITALTDAAIIKEAAKIANFAELKAEYIAAEKAKVNEKDWKEPSEITVAKAVIAAYNEDATTEIDTDKVSLAALEAVYAANGIDDTFKAAVKAKYEADNYNYSYLYASFLDTYLSTYTSEWNIGVKLNIGGKDYTKMCVPNIMMFNGEGEGKAVLVALAEAEYNWPNTNTDGHPQKESWTSAVKAVFDANPYLTYAPVMVAEQAPTTDAGSTGGSTGGATGGASDGGC